MIVMKVLVTGAGGYIGRHVVDCLLKNKDTEVIAADIFTDGINPASDRISVNIFDRSEDIFEKLGSPDVCIHLAWKDGFVHNSEAHMGMLSDHFIFINNMIKGGLKQLSVMGTMHEIGYFEGAIDENTPCNPTSMYGIAKDALRKAVLQLGKSTGCTVNWLRAYYIYGDDAKSNSIFAKLTAAEQEGKELFPFTTGKNKYDFIHVDELAEQIAAASCQNEITGIINVCTGIPVSLADKVEGYIKEHGFKIKLQYGAFPDRPYDSPGVWGNADKIKRIMEKKVKGE